MRPINLVIKGLNSFKEEGRIDFRKLTDSGLFGIFGPTGSGKSTILDGITLALYGKTSRNSSNFINTQCDEMSVEYEFQIRDKEVKQYIIDRTFKRNKEGRINAKKPTRIIEIIDGEQVVVAEDTNAVDKKCIDILGLKFEDFIRTVVLPQGKFSEFLKLEGKPRREMLERLFSLDKYGDDLAIKLGTRIKKEKSEMDKIIGELNSYKDISEEVYENKRTELELKKIQEKNLEKELEEVTTENLEGEKLWTLQQELQSYRKDEKELEGKKETIDGYKIKAVKGESSLKVKPYIDAANRTLGEIKVTEENLKRDESLLEKLTKDKKQIEISFEESRLNKDNEIPNLKVIENNVNQAIDEYGQKQKLNVELVTLNGDNKKLNEKKIIEETKIIKLDEEIDNLNKNITVHEQKVCDMKIDQVHRERVQEGLNIQDNLERVIKKDTSLNEDVNATCTKMNNLSKHIASLETIMKEKSELLSIKDKELEKINNNYPGDADLLLLLQSNIGKTKTVVEKGNNFKEELKNLNKEILKLLDLISSDGAKKIDLEKDIDRLNKSIEDINKENLALILREGLKKGERCPVCGSIEHYQIDGEKIDNAVLDSLKIELNSKSEGLITLENILLTNKVKLDNNEENKEVIEEELKKLGDKWITINIDELTNEFVLKKHNIEEWNSSKQTLEKNIKVLNEELNKININYSKDRSSLNENEIVYNKYSEELKVAKQELSNFLENLNYLKKELQVDDFSKRALEIKNIDNERDNLENKIKKDRNGVKDKVDEREVHKRAISNFEVKLATLETQIEEKSNQVLQKQQSIRAKVGERENLFDYRDEILKNIEKIEKTFVKIEKQKLSIEDECNRCDGNFKAYELQLAKSKYRIDNEKLMLQEALKNEGFKDDNEALKFTIPLDKIKQLKEDIEKYENTLSILKSKIEDVTQKIDGKSITYEKWCEIQELKKNKEKEIKEVRNTVVRIDTELLELKKKLNELKDLTNKKEILEHKLSLLNDLDGLFRGKRFVEFVATHQLKYVSLEGSKWLKEISGGIYGLEVDEDGKFIIRDYKNGGATRDASTLSGGETFLASLSLALALSAQIQLKGTAPLELFFLDEGFGTLDDNLLEVVMGSLEKIHNDKLSVGIISHVESIKNRVPIKLIVSPAKAGIGGSKIRIERS